MPTSLRDKHILLKSMQLQFSREASFTEREVNGQLESWMRDIAPGLDSDVANLRRMLVDYGYLIREPDGSRYNVGGDGTPFAADVNHLDPVAMLRDAQSQRAERKRTRVAEKEGL